MDTVVRFISSLFPFYLFILIFGRERELYGLWKLL